MPYVVRWSPRALAGMRRLHLFLMVKDAEAAKKAAENILNYAGILEKFPSVGRPAADLDPEHRELLIPFGSSGYVLLYHAEKDSNILTVLAIRHQREVECVQP